MYGLAPRDEVSSSDLNSEAAQLIAIGFTTCGNVVAAGVPPSEGPVIFLAAASTEENRVVHAAGSGSETKSDSVLVHVVRRSGSGPTTLALGVKRSAEVTLAPGETVPAGIAPFESHAGFWIVNAGETSASLDLTMSAPPSQGSLALSPNEGIFIAPYTGPRVPDFSLSIENLSTSSPATIDIQEMGYFYSLALDDAPTGSNSFDAILRRVGDAGDLIKLQAIGLDPNPGSEVTIVVSAPGVPTGVEPPEWPPDARTDLAAMTRVIASPNPFRDRAVISLDLHRQGSVEAEFFDVTGRRVRSISQAHAAPGRLGIEWNGAGDRDEPLAAGVYFYRLTLDGKVGPRGKLTLVR